MRPKTKCRLLNAASATSFLVGSLAISWAFLPPNKPQEIVESDLANGFTATERLPLLTNKDLASLLDKRLQGPPTIIKQKPIAKVAPIVTPPPQIKWPNITLDCVLFGEKAKLAVIAVGDQSKVTCREGEQVSEVLVERIEADRIVASFRGEQKTLQTKRD